MASVAMLPAIRDYEDSAKSTGEDSDDRKRRHSSSDSDDRERERRRRRRDDDTRERRRRSRDRDRSDRDYERGPRYWGSRSPSPDRSRSNWRSDDRQRSHRGDGDDDDRRRSNRDLYWNKYSGGSGRNRRDDKDTRRRKDDEPDGKAGAKISTDGETLPDKNKAKTDGAEALTLRTGGAYIPPAKLRMMQEQLTDKNSIAFQRFAWEALKKSINGLINKVNVSNIAIIVRELFKENVIRGRGLFARSVMQAQAASPTFTHVYASLVSIVNSKFPQIGELILTRLIVQFRRGFRRNDKNICLSSTRFLAHLVNQQMAHEIVALQILTLLLENVTNHSVEVAIGFLKECGAKLTEVTPRGINAVFDRLRSVLHDGQVDDRTRYMIEVMFAVRKDGFKDHPIVVKELDLTQEEDQFTHSLQLQEATNGEDILNVFKHDPDYETNEEKYKTIRSEILDEGSSDESDGSGGSGSESEEGEEDGEGAGQEIIDNTETNLVSLRRTIYLTIQSSMDFQECTHKLLKMELKPTQEPELCHMILDCCAQQRTYEKFFGLLAQRFCQLNKAYVEPFEAIFRDSYDTIHRLETNKLRNVAKLFAHLLYTDAISWAVLGHIKLNEEDTTSSSRIFIKILFQELAEYMGLPKLNERAKDPTLQEAFTHLFPRDHPPNTRFAINFFTSIGLGGLTDELREHLKSQPKINALPPPPTEIAPPSSSESSDDESSSSDSDSSSTNSSSSSSDSSSEQRKRKRTGHSKRKTSPREKSSKKRPSVVTTRKNAKTSKKSHHRRS